MAASLAEQRADFGKADDQGDCGCDPDARNGGQNGHPPGQERIGGDQAFDFRAEIGDRCLGGAELTLDLGDGLGEPSSRRAG